MPDDSLFLESRPVPQISPTKLAAKIAEYKVSYKEERLLFDAFQEQADLHWRLCQDIERKIETLEGL